MACVRDFFKSPLCCRSSLIMVGSLLSLGICLYFFIVYFALHEVALASVDKDGKGYICKAPNGAKFGEDLTLMFKINWGVYLFLAVGCIFSCLGGFILCCRMFAGFYHILPGLILHIGSLVYTAIMIYSEDGEYCAIEGNE